MINKYFKQHQGKHVRPSIVCEDGAKFSVQASDTHYCSPRIKEAEFYYEVEVGFPSTKEELLMPYAEDPERPTSTVYGYVPVKIVEAVIKSHGGIKK